MRLLATMRRLAHGLHDALYPRRPVPIFYDPAYRLPMTTAQARLGLEPRRADLAVWFLETRGWLDPDQLRVPPRIHYAALSRVHEAAWLESLTQPEVLAQVFGVEAWDVPVDPLMNGVRLACGGTLAAARLALSIRGPVMNLLGGFHHAYPHRGAGLCPVNDVAVAVAALRADGYNGRIAVLDFDAHPPDGTAACLGSTIWHASISGSDWGVLPDVREVVLPEGTGDELWLATLDSLLGEMPPCGLTFVLAGGDVLAGDPMGRLAVTLAGAAERDRRVAQHLGEMPAVWLPAGGYKEDAWKVLVGTAGVLMRGRPPRVSSRADPMRDHFRLVAQGIDRDHLGAPDPDALDLSDVEAELGLKPRNRARLLDFYTAEGIEYALFRQGVVTHIERLGYRELHVELVVGGAGAGDRLCLWGRLANDEEGTSERHLLMEASLQRRRRPDGGVLYVHWLTLRHPAGGFARGRPALPGQEVPGLGMAKEAITLLGRMAERLGLGGVVVRPAWFHVAYVGRSRFRFVEPAAQGVFDALVRDLQAHPVFRQLDGTFALARASAEVAAGNFDVERDGHREPYVWPADEVIDFLGKDAVGHSEAFRKVREQTAATTRFHRRTEPESEPSPVAGRPHTP